MSSSGLIYAVIVGAWAAYLVPMWLRRQDELNEARPTERFSTAIRLLSGRAGMERRYAKDLRTRSADEPEPGPAPGDATDSVDVRAFAMPPAMPPAGNHRPAPPQQAQAPSQAQAQSLARVQAQAQARVQAQVQARLQAQAQAQARVQAQPKPPAQATAPAPAASGPASAGARPAEARRTPRAARAAHAPRTPAAEAAAARARRSKVLARRRRTTVVLFLAFTVGAIVAAVGGLAFLWAPGVPAVMLSAYIAYLRSQERRRFAYQMDRQRAEAAAQRLRERERLPRRSASATAVDPDEPEADPEPATDPGLSALAADRRALVEQTDHAEWVDQQRERQRGPGRGESWDPVPVPLPTYVTAPVAPRATSDVDLGAPDAWSSARSSSVARDQEQQPGAEEGEPGAEPPAPEPAAEDRSDDDGRSDARRAASARRARERGRTPLFDQYDPYEDGDRPRAANE
ncbi:gephyrin-like molybdotransferase receptor GlpR [Streptomyces sp. NPDC093252]|uniref:gephyrin-like molybdotransferase receptor GlpR n=1 Tax=Streptomyces sp. NPDC093252 TaxID=3154980 RepID=UPI00343048DF